MARPAKAGIDYFSKDVSFYEDDKVRLLRAEFGAKGMYLLDYMLCDLYGKNGYYMKWDKEKCFLVSDGAGCGLAPNFIGEFVAGCVRCSFFDKRVFDLFGVLTSAGIQRRFVRALNSRGKFTFIEEYFLLDLTDTEDVPAGILNKLAFKKVSDTENPVKSKENPVLFTDNAQKKRKEKKIEEKKEAAAADSDFAEVVKAYEENIGLPSGVVGERIADWLKDADKSLLVYAIEQAALHNKRNFSYINAILNHHVSNGRRTRAEAEGEEYGNTKGNTRENKATKEYGTVL